MNIVVVGDGKVGYTLTEQLSREGHDMVVIDNSSKALSNSTNALDVIGIHGNGVSYQVQKEAGVDKADLLIAATSSDEINMLCCMVAKKLGAKNTIARVRNPEYAMQMVFLKEELGLSLVINPEQAAAAEISRILRFPSALKVDTFARGRVELVEYKLREGTPLDGLPLYALSRKYRFKILICAVQRGAEVYIPTGDFILRTGDKLTITATPKEIEGFFKAIGAFSQRVKDVMIIGGGRITFYLALRLIESGIRVKVIEQDEKKCMELSDYLPKAMIIHGDGTDRELLSEEGIASVDAFVTLTGMDEENIIISMYAAAQHVKKVITKVSRTDFADMLSGSGLDTFIIPKSITATQIVRYVRAMQNSLGSNVETLYQIVNGKVEALEFHAREKARCIGVPLKDLALVRELLIACIIRKGRIIVPGGDDSILAGDSVVVVTTNGGLDDLDDILA